MKSPDRDNFQAGREVYAVAIGQRLGMSEPELRQLRVGEGDSLGVLDLVKTIVASGLIGKLPAQDQLNDLLEAGFEQELIEAYAHVARLVQPIA